MTVGDQLISINQIKRWKKSLLTLNVNETPIVILNVE